jgi:hypothetical protein
MTWKETEESLIDAILNGDLGRIGDLVKSLRFDAKLDYCGSAALVHRLTGLSEADWDELLYEVDSGIRS